MLIELLSRVPLSPVSTIGIVRAYEGTSQFSSTISNLLNTQAPVEIYF